MKKTLVVMAAGMGSRYGGLKQIEPVGPNGEFIIDYSVYDAIRCGFSKIVFIIKDEIYDTFMDTIAKRLPNNVDIEYAFQRMDDIPVEVDLGSRTKPLGTTHAIYCARNHIEGNFGIINADDFYGYGSYEELSEFLDNDITNPETYCVVGYKVKNTITDNGSVKRGVCFEKDGFLSYLDESLVEKDGNKYVRTSLSTGKKEKIDGETYVSMNMLGFPEVFLKRVEEALKEFLQDNNNDLTKDECLIPIVVGNLLEKDEVKVKLLETHEKWYGVTYKEDKALVVDAINKMIKDGVYSHNLWEK